MQSSETHPSSEMHFCFINNISVCIFSSLSVVTRGLNVFYFSYYFPPFYSQITPAIIYAINF